MRVNDQKTQEYIDEIQTDNLTLRVELELANQEIRRLRVELNERFSNPDGVD